MGFPVEGFESGQRYRRAARRHLRRLVSEVRHDLGAVHRLSARERGSRRSRSGRASTTCSRISRKSARSPCARCRSRGSIKTHLPFARTPWSAQAKYVYVARNPFDCAVSFYHHTRGFVRHYDFAGRRRGRRSSSASCAARSTSAITSTIWSRGGRTERRPNVLFLTYEHMLAAPAAAVGSIARFLGGRAGELARDPRRLEGVVRHSDFRHMQSDQDRWSSRRPAGMPAFVRKGVVGDWRSHFTADQTRRLAAKFRACTAGTTIGDLWPGLVADSLE